MNSSNDKTLLERAQAKSIRIANSDLTIYDSLDAQPQLNYSAAELQALLNVRLEGLKLDQPIRTRSKVVKSAICRSIGYPVPASFKKTQPRFPGQDFDAYVQKSNNLQIWNEDLAASRRYVLVRVDATDLVTSVRVITGGQLAKLDSTGTLTSKYQASARLPVTNSRLISPNDTTDLVLVITESNESYARSLLPIDRLFVQLKPLVGKTFGNPGADQERNRGWGLHKLVSKQLGLKSAQDDGQVPDVVEQLLELKLQTSPTVDLGLITPGSAEPLDGFPGLRLADIRYAIFYATVVKAESDGESSQIRLDHLVLTNGADFFSFFEKLGGNIVNKKNQIRLPKDFFGAGG